MLFRRGGKPLACALMAYPSPNSAPVTPPLSASSTVLRRECAGQLNGACFRMTKCRVRCHQEAFEEAINLTDGTTVTSLQRQQLPPVQKLCQCSGRSVSSTISPQLIIFGHKSSTPHLWWALQDALRQNNSICTGACIY